MFLGHPICMMSENHAHSLCLGSPMPVSLILVILVCALPSVSLKGPDLLVTVG